METPPLRAFYIPIQLQDLSSDSNLLVRTAYNLISLLRLQSQVLAKRSWNGSSKDYDHCEDLISRIWAEFVQECEAPGEIEQVLWLAFPLEEGSERSLRVVDCLASSALLSHQAVVYSLMHTWKHGFAVSPNLDTSLSQRAWQRFDANCTPRVVHAIDSICHLASLAFLSHYLLYPPSRPIIANGLTSNGPREILLLYSLASVLRPWSLLTIPHLLVFLSFTVCLPFSPFPEEASFTALLIAFGLQLLQLHFPFTPSPLFILPVQGTLPLTTFILQTIKHIIFPVLGLVIPAFLFTSFLLSISLTDGVIPVLNAHFVDAAPMETRSALLVIALAELVFFSWSILVLAASFPSLFSSSPKADTWDRYSKQIGSNARRRFCRAVRSYSSPYYLPPPFNLVRLVIVTPIRTFLCLTGRKGPNPHLDALKRFLWRFTVGPVSLIVAGLWLWGWGS